MADVNMNGKLPASCTQYPTSMKQTASPAQTLMVIAWERNDQEPNKAPYYDACVRDLKKAFSAADIEKSLSGDK